MNNIAFSIMYINPTFPSGLLKLYFVPMPLQVLLFQAAETKTSEVLLSSVSAVKQLAL